MRRLVCIRGEPPESASMGVVLNVTESQFPARHPGTDRQFILIPGLGLSARYLNRLAESLSLDGDVWIAEVRMARGGFPGRTPTMSDVAGAVVGWMQNRHLGPAVILGHSFGAQVAIELALQAPARVQGLVLASPAIDSSARTFFGQFWRLMRNALREPLRMVLIAIFDYLRHPHHVLRMFRAALADPTEDKLPAIVVPALVIRGARDVVVSAKWEELVAHLLPGGELITIPDAAHAVVYSAAQQVADAVAEFTERACARGIPWDNPPRSA